MKSIKKNSKRNIVLLLPLAAVLLGVLIMKLQQPSSMQALMPVPMPQSFLGEYSYDGTNWYPLEADEDLSAKNRELYLRGHFEQVMHGDGRLYFYTDHIGCEIFLNGELVGPDIILEMDRYGKKIHPSMCSKEWKYHYFPEEVPTDTLVEIHLKNPHKFGNENAYKDFLNTLCCTPNNEVILSESLVNAGQPYNVIGVSLIIVGVLLLCSALVSSYMGIPVEITLIPTGLLAVFAGGYFLLDTIDLCFRSHDHIFNTYSWQICMMYSVYLLGIMGRDLLSAKRKKTATYLMVISAVVDVALILLAFTEVLLMYDTLYFWVMLQWVICPVFMICCAGELLADNREKPIDIAVFLLIFICILLDCMGVADSIYFSNLMTKTAVVLLFVLKLIQFSKSIIISIRASNRAHKLEKELEESRIALMISQIQPHFIFNVLGTIRGLCRENPIQAWHGLGDFSVYLRANMNALTNEKAIPFEKELAHVETYIRLEQMRMGEKLNVVYDIQEKEFSIPPLMLQPLVENAVKHGLFYKVEGGTIIIRSRKTDGKIILTVQDDGIGFEAAARESDFDQREHHGLENVRSRVEKMLGGSLRIDSHPERGSTVTLEFPIDNS